MTQQTSLHTPSPPAMQRVYEDSSAPVFALVTRTGSSCSPEQRFSEHIKDEKNAEFPQRFILKRDDTSMDRDDNQVRAGSAVSAYFLKVKCNFSKIRTALNSSWVFCSNLL